MYAVLALHSEAFADKFGAAFGTEGVGRGVEAMAEAWRRQGVSAMRGMFVATVGETVVGTVTVRTWEMGNDDSGAAELAFQKVLGAWGAFRSIFTLSLLSHQIARDEGYVTDVAVLSTFRRRGIARILLARAEEEARARRKRFLSLYVSSANTGAQTLYTREGYHRARTRRSLMAGLVLHESRWLFMRKDLG